MTNTKSFDVRPMPQQISSALLGRAAGVEPATIGHFQLRGFPAANIRRLVRSGPRMVGTAVTLALPALDSTLLHHAAGLLREGDILLIDRLGDTRYACLGGGVATALANAHVKAAVVDGPCADPVELESSGVQVWGTGISSVTTRVLGIGGAMNVPVNIGGAVALPGDLVIIDDGGIVLIPADVAEATVDRALSMQEREGPMLAQLGANRLLGDISGASALVTAKISAAE